MIGMTFANPSDYDLIGEADTINFLDLNEFSPNKQLTLKLTHGDGSNDTIKCNHTYNASQIDWYQAGSALNLIKSNAGV
jgi:aconitate hydratase A / 2-methylisocitrate dehydratase